MKKTIFTSILILLISVAYAQEPTTSQGKQAFTTLNASLEKLKTLDPTAFSYQTEIDKASKRIQTIKQYEPNFDLSANEQLLQSYIKAQQEGLAAKEAKRAAADDAASASGDLYTEMEDLFSGPTTGEFQSGVDSKLSPNAEEILNNYKQKTDAFIANGAADRIQQAKEYNRYIEPKNISYERVGLEDVLKKMDGYVRTSVEADGALVNYYAIKKYEIYWSTLEKAMPDDVEVKSNAVLARKYAAGLPSVGEIKSTVEANKKASLASVKVPSAIRRDAGMETQFRNAFNAQGWNETIYKINLLDSDWHIERNSLTGVIIGRYQTAAITTKNSNGDCILYTFSIMQEYNGSGYQSTARRSGHNSAYMSCENAQ